MPPEAMLILPGEALASAISSATVFAGSEGCTTSTNGVVATRLTGAKSRTGWYEIFGYRLGATLTVLFDPIISV